MQERQDAAVHVHHQCECPLTGRRERTWSKIVIMYLWAGYHHRGNLQQSARNKFTGSFKSESANDSWVFSCFPWHQGDPNKSSSWQGWRSSILLVGNSHHHPKRWRRWPCWGHPKGRSWKSHTLADFISFIYLFCVEYSRVCTSILVKTRIDLMHSPAPPH